MKRWKLKNLLLSTFRFFQGCFYAGTIPSFVLLMELVGSSKRGFVGTVSGLWFSFGIVLYAGLAYFVRDWRELVVILNVAGLVVPASMLCAHFFLMKLCQKLIYLKGK